MTIKQLPTQSRDFQGYRQYLECFEIGNKEVFRWVFYVTSFSLDLSKAYVLKSDSTEDALPIDAQDRILIKGRRYGPKYWNH